MKNLLFCLLVLIALSDRVYAQYAVAQPLVGGTSMSLYGLGEYINLGENIYIGALYIPQLERNIKPGSSKRMEMRIVADTLSARRFSQLWIDAITLNSTRDERVAQAAQIQKFGKLFQDDLIRGDSVSFEYLESGNRTLVLINQVQIGTIPGIAFFDMVLAAWVGNKPLSGQLKAGILGQGGTDKNALIKRQFAEIAYTEQRYRQIAGKYGRR